MQSMLSILASMTTPQLEGARAHLAMMSNLEPGRDMAIDAIDSELLGRDRSLYKREEYASTRLARLAKTSPMLGKKEPAMQKKIWYGANGNAVAFANNENALVSQGITNPKSFTTTGDVTGLDLIDAGSSAASGQQQPVSQG